METVCLSLEIQQTWQKVLIYYLRIKPGTISVKSAEESSWRENGEQSSPLNFSEPFKLLLNLNDKRLRFNAEISDKQY